MNSGTVKIVFADRGFGFVASERGDIFFHVRGRRKIAFVGQDGEPRFTHPVFTEKLEFGALIGTEVVYELSPGSKGRFFAQPWAPKADYEMAPREPAVELSKSRRSFFPRSF